MAACKLSRRAFTRALAVTAVAPALARCSRAVEKAQVLVIGAGIAGLYAAWLLQQRGIVPLVIEASDRVGGRMRELDVLRGASPVPAAVPDVPYTRLRRLLTELGIESDFEAVDSQALALHINGTLLDAGRWSDSAANRLQGAERPVLPHQIVDFYLDRNMPLAGPGDWLRKDLAGFDRRSLGEELRRSGASAEALRLAGVLYDARGLEQVSALFAYHRRWLDNAGSAQLRIRGGSLRLPEALAAALKNEVHLRHAVARIDVDDAGVECRCANGSRYRAPLALCAIPWSVLRQVVLAPEPAQAPIIRSLPYNTITEVKLACRRPFWEDDGLPPAMVSDDPFERIYAVPSADGSLSTLSCWMNGQRAAKLDDWNADRIGRFVLREISAARPAAAGALDVLGVSAAGQNVYALGAHHLWGPGQFTRFGESAREPWGGVYWIGEHAALHQQGIEGAMESAEREVQALVQRLQG